MITSSEAQDIMLGFLSSQFITLHSHEERYMIFVWSPTYLWGLVGLNVPEYAINICITFFKKTMAIISIPTSIGGITIPGLNKGPLGSLFGNPFSSTSLQYPSDLGSANKNHMVRFDIREIVSAEIDLNKYTKGVDLTFDSWDSALNSAESIGNATATVYNDIKNFATTATKNIADTEKTFTENLSPEVGRILSTIQLYMPDSMDFQLGIDYDSNSSALKAAESLPLVGNTATKINSTLQNSAIQLALKKFGYAVNPQLQVLFQGINFREYSMSFVFSPNSREEAQNIQKIIKLFRGYAAPEIVRNTKGMFYRPPAYFDISFYSNGAENTKINRIKRSVVKSVDVNYAPNGWAAHADGAPVQTTMTLGLQEIVLIDRNEIFNNGY